MAGWYQTGEVPANNVGGTIAEFRDSSNRGVRLWVDSQTYHGSYVRIVPKVTIGSVAGDETYFENHSALWNQPTVVLETQFTWAHFAVTYDSSNRKLRLYVDGVLLFTKKLIFWPSTPTPSIYLGSSVDNPGATAVSPSGRWDEWHFYLRLVGGSSLARLAAGAYGTQFPDDIFAGYHFDDGADPTAVDFSGNSNDLTVLAPMTLATAHSGKVNTPGLGDLKRGRFRVEFLRINYDSTNARCSDTVEWSAIKTIVDDALSYPGMVLVGGEIVVNDQINSSAPRITLVGKWKKALVWDGQDPTRPTFNREWSAYPPWQAAHMLLDPRQGARHEFDPADLDVEAFKEVADRCAEVVYDKRGDKQLSSDGDWLDATYDSTVVDPVTGDERGAVSINMAGWIYPAQWKVGRYLRFTGWPAPATGVNNGATGGYLIYAIDNGPLGKIVRVYWDQDTAAWGGAAGLNSHLNPQTVADYDCYVEGGEPRFEAHGGFDTEHGFWDALMKLLSVCRAIPVKVGRRVSVKDDRPRTPVDVVGHASVLPGSWEVEYEWNSSRHNHYDAQYLDAEYNHEPRGAALTAQSVDDPSTFNGIRRGSMFVEFVTSRAQLLRHLAYMLNVNESITRRGKFKTSVEGLAIEPHSVVRIGHDLMGWGTSGLVKESDAVNSLKLDQAVTLQAGTAYTYFVSIRDGRTGTFEVVQVTTPGVTTTYAVGDSVPLDASFSFIPTEDDRYLLWLDGDDVEAVVNGCELDDELRKGIEWTEYVESVHTDDWFEDIDASDQTGEPEVSATTIPGDPDEVVVVEHVHADRGGAPRTALHVAWKHDETTLEVVARTVVHGGEVGEEPARIAEVPGVQNATEFLLPHGVVQGDVYVVYLQPVSRAGSRKRVSLCVRVAVRVEGYAVPPDTGPSTLVVERVDDLVTYRWGRVDDPSLTYAVRIGGWVLGQEVGRVPTGEPKLGPTPFWASCGADAAGRQGPDVLVRAVTAAGRLSPAALTTFAFDFDHEGLVTLEDEAWHDFGNGFIWDAPTLPNGTLTDLERVDGGWEGSYLQFKSGTGEEALVGYYETPSLSAVGAQHRRYHVEAFVEAWQRHPATWADLDVAWGDPKFRDWTWEGPIDERPDARRCSITIEVRYEVGDVWGDWETYRPGVKWCQWAQFRLKVERPADVDDPTAGDTGFDVRVLRFCSRITNVPPTDNQRTDEQLWGESELNA